MCEKHAAMGIPCLSMESIGSAVMAAPKVIAGTLLGVGAAMALGFVLANIVWFGLGVLAVAAATGTVLVRRIRREFRTPTWHPGLAATPARLNGVRRPAVEAPRRPAVEAPKVAAVGAEQYQSLAGWAGRSSPSGTTVARSAGPRVSTMGEQCDRCAAPVMDNGEGRTVHVELADIIFCNLVMAQTEIGSTDRRTS